MFKKAILTILVLNLLACSDKSDQTKSTTPAQSKATVAQAQTAPPPKIAPKPQNYRVERKNGNMGLLNQQGEVVIPFEYNRLELSDDEKTLLALKKDSELYGFIDISGKEILPFKYKKATAFSEGLAAVSEDGKKMGFIDLTGKWGIPAQYDWHVSARYQFTDGAVVVYQDASKEIKNPLNGETASINVAKSAVINVKNEIIVPFGQYEHIDGFREGLARVEIKVKSDGMMDNGKIDLGRRFGFINTKGELAIPTIYYDAAVFREGLVNVAIKDKYGFIDQQGNTVIPFEYDNHLHSYVSNGFATMVKKRDGSIICASGVIDMNNRVIVPFEYHRIQYTEDGFSAIGCENDKNILFNRDGKRMN